METTHQQHRDAAGITSQAASDLADHLRSCAAWLDVVADPDRAPTVAPSNAAKLAAYGLEHVHERGQLIAGEVG